LHSGRPHRPHTHDFHRCQNCLRSCQLITSLRSVTTRITNSYLTQISLRRSSPNPQTSSIRTGELWLRRHTGWKKSPGSTCGEILDRVSLDCLTVSKCPSFVASCLPRIERRTRRADLPYLSSLFSFVRIRISDSTRFRRQELCMATIHTPRIPP
jgi:hypothetical protein